MSVGIVDFDSTLIQNQIASAHGFPGHICRQYTKAARCMLQFPGYPSVYMQTFSALHAASPHITVPDCRGNSVPGL